MNAAENEPLIESPTDSAETWMTYGPGRIPWWVLGIWITALGGLIGYLAAYYFPDLWLWGAP